MKIVLQCAARKQISAGLLRDDSGEPVLFVARPEEAPPEAGLRYARPDDPRDELSGTWRQFLVQYNRASVGNPLGLLPAFRLYANPAYVALAERYGTENLYILSAGWGLIPADYLTPNYDITFSASAESYKRRRKGDVYDDFACLDADYAGPLVYFGGKDYRNLFDKLTSSHRGRRFVYYNAVTAPQLANCTLIRYETRTRTNWHYECVRDFIAGKLVRPA